MFGTLQCHVVLNATVVFTVIKNFTQNATTSCFSPGGGTTWWKTTRFSLTKTKISFPHFTPNIMKINCTNIILSFKDMFDVSAILLQNASETAVTIHRCLTLARLCHASLHVMPPTSTKFPVVQVDHGRPLPSHLWTHCYERFCSARWTGWFCPISYAVILVVVVESEIPIVHFCHFAL